MGTNERVGRGYGQLSDIDMKHEMETNNLFIYPFIKKNLTSCAYNLTPSSFVLSIKKGILEKVYSKRGTSYVWIAPHDTALISTNEYISIGKSIAGTFHSRVKIVSQGYGHISTTLDPNWKGPLLIALNNPSSKRKKFIIEKNDGNSVPFVTLHLHYLNTVSETPHDNPPYRIDILQEYIAKPLFFQKMFFKKGFRKFNDIINTIQDSVDIRQVKNYSDPYLDNIESVLRELKSRLSPSVSKIEHGELDEIIFNAEFASKCISDTLLKILRDIQKELSPQSKEGETALPKVDIEKVTQLIKSALDRCKLERVGEYWLKCFNQVKQEIDDYSAQASGLRFFWGGGWKRFLLILLAAGYIASLVLFIGNSVFQQYILAPLTTFVVTVGGLLIYNKTR